MSYKPLLRVSKLRKELGISQEQLAELLDTTQSQVSQYERGKNEPSAHVLEVLADVLDTTVDYILERTDNPKRPLRNELDLDEVEREALQILRSKKPADRKRVVEIMKLA